MGEEDESVINIVEKPFTVDDLTVPDEFNPIIETTLAKVSWMNWNPLIPMTSTGNPHVRIIFNFNILF